LPKLTARLLLMRKPLNLRKSLANPSNASYVKYKKKRKGEKNALRSLMPYPNTNWSVIS
jgi:hypothetical protein